MKKAKKENLGKVFILFFLVLFLDLSCCICIIHKFIKKGVCKMKIIRKIEILDEGEWYRLRYYDKKNKVTITTRGFDNKKQMMNIIKKYKILDILSK